MARWYPPTVTDISIEIPCRFPFRVFCRPRKVVDCFHSLHVTFLLPIRLSRCWLLKQPDFLRPSPSTSTSATAAPGAACPADGRFNVRFAFLNCRRSTACLPIIASYIYRSGRCKCFDRSAIGREIRWACKLNQSVSQLI